MSNEIDEGSDSKPDYVDIVCLVRSIQRAEGDTDCYRSGRHQCDRMDCIWRDHCLMAPTLESAAPVRSQEKKEALDSRRNEGG